ncbi:sulfotransferase domain-containing protein [Alphaproteobacteria bacterium]|nr:sulfotransferase domain-containing protein [Alphaproteobacteria bacterium]
MKKIIWISSYPKSGNTWTRYFLSNYFFNKQKTNSDFNILNKIDKFPTYKILQQLLIEDEIKENTYNISKFWHDIQLEITKEKDDFIFLKNHNALVSLEGRNLTDEKFSLAFIYLVRDPRDIAISYSNFDKKLSIDKAIERITCENLYCHISKELPLDVEVLGSWKFNYFSWKTGVAEVPRIIIKYEDLINNTFETKLKIIKFLSKILNFKVDTNHIKYSIKQSDFKRLQGIENHQKFHESTNTFFNSGKIGQWKNILSLKQINRIENFCKDEMKELGYL